MRIYILSSSSVFLSTPSARRATHLPSDWFPDLRYFYPRPPRGGRPATSFPCWQASLFLSTPSARRATATTPAPPAPLPYFYPRPPRGGRRPLWSDRRTGSVISIHALREEGDPWLKANGYGELVFLSTPSARRATSDPGVHIEIGGYFYPRPPRGGRLTVDV